ncbi:MULTISPECIES: DUF4190 domain-containing protein [Bacillaceae]|uniref:DUF4190 domain-containing protein n=1 Tax=Bacillaceae TaxID=186817 RepID=UPI001C58B08D|nr:DUF4190 domain-containing protein [Rossellomorea sp. YZS02]MBW3112425.1 DUF4190 domain-containing protein [Bacillus sp. MCCB 382]MDX8342555.1 DUF4190 domain-containing protein [Rossellomorea sp. YZS02]
MNAGNELERKGLNGKAVASFILGIVSIVIVIIPLIGAVLGLVGVILGLIARHEVKGTNQEGRNIAIAGVVFSFIGILFSICWVMMAYMTFS